MSFSIDVGQCCVSTHIEYEVVLVLACIIVARWCSDDGRRGEVKNGGATVFLVHGRINFLQTRWCLMSVFKALLRQCCS
jgi:hypothetical protein